MGAGYEAEGPGGKAEANLADATDNSALETGGPAEQSTSYMPDADEETFEEEWDVDRQIQIDDKR